MAKSGAEHFARKLLVNTWDLKTMKLWCMDMLSPAWMCVDVQCEKTAVMKYLFMAGGIVHQMGPTLKMFMFVLGTPFSIRRFLEKETFNA